VTSAIFGALALAIIFIYLVLASQFGSFLQPLAIMTSLPLSIVGVMLALLVTGTTLNIFSMIGIVFLMGLVTKNAILLVDFANQGQRKGMERSEALLAAGQTRLRPILMTTAAMIFGMLPLALGLGEGAEQQAPMGRAIIGGVITSTLLTLVVVPVIYSYLDAWEARWFRRGHARGVPALNAQPADRQH
jgi:multidrug efflux pump subunit AcrB